MWEFFLFAPFCLKQESVRSAFDGNGYLSVEQCYQARNFDYHVGPQVFAFPAVTNNIYPGIPDYFNFQRKSYEKHYNGDNINNYFYDGDGSAGRYYDDTPMGALVTDGLWDSGSSRMYRPGPLFEEGHTGSLRKTYSNEQFNQHSQYINENRQFGQLNFGKTFNDHLGVAGHYITKPFETPGPDDSDYKNGQFDQNISGHDHIMI